MKIGDSFGQSLKKLRKRKALTQRELAGLVGYTRAYISALETNACAPSMAVLKKLASALGVAMAELLGEPPEQTRRIPIGDCIPIVNDRASTELAPPAGTRPGDWVLIPGVSSRNAFAAYLPDDSMSPDFGKGDLVVFSLTQPGTDGAACLVDTGKGVVVFRTALALPGRMWRLQPSNPRYEPMVIRETKAVRMWPAIGRWQALPARPAR